MRLPVSCTSNHLQRCRSSKNRFCAFVLDRAAVHPSFCFNENSNKLDVSEINALPPSYQLPRVQVSGVDIKAQLAGEFPYTKIGFPHCCAWCGFRYVMKYGPGSWIFENTTLMPFLRLSGSRKLPNIAFQAPLVSKPVTCMARMQCIKECYDHSLWVGTSESAGTECER